MRLCSTSAALCAALAVVAVAGCDGGATTPEQQLVLDTLAAEWNKIQFAPYATRCKMEADRSLRNTGWGLSAFIQSEEYMHSCMAGYGYRH